MGLTSEFQTAVVNEPSVFEALKFYCILWLKQLDQDLQLVMEVENVMQNLPKSNENSASGRSGYSITAKTAKRQFGLFEPYSKSYYKT